MLPALVGDTGKPDVEVIPLDLGDAAADVAAEGNYQHFTLASLLGLSYAILNSAVANSGSIYIGLASGGPVAVMYGTVTATICASITAFSLSELCHVWPTQGAHYAWTFALCRNHIGTRFLTYMVGFITTAGWIALSSTAPSLAGQFVASAANMFHPDWLPSDWAIFVVHCFFVAYGTAISIFGARILDLLNKVSLVWSITSVVIIFITLLACTGAHHQLRDSKWIFATFLNQTGWNDGVCWILGLLQAQYSLVGADGAAHLVSEIPRPSMNAPIAMFGSCLVGGTASFILLISVLASIHDTESIIAAQGGGILYVFNQSLKNLAGSVFLGTIAFATVFFTLPALMCTSSRMIQSFANDNNLPFKRYLGHTSEKFEVPVYATLFNTFWLMVFGVLLFSSPVVVPAIQSSSVIMLQLSYFPCIVGMLLWGRRRMEEKRVKRQWSAGKVGGAILNVVSLCYLLLTCVCFTFPSTYPVTSGSQMNWAIVVLAIVILLALINWFAWARKRFQGPSEFFDNRVQLQTLYQ